MTKPSRMPPELAARARAGLKKVFLEDYGANQTKLANVLGVTPAAVSHILSGKNAPSLRLAEKIAELLGVSSAELLGIQTGESAKEESPASPQIIASARRAALAKIALSKTLLREGEAELDEVVREIAKVWRTRPSEGTARLGPADLEAALGHTSRRIEEALAHLSFAEAVADLRRCTKAPPDEIVQDTYDRLMLVVMEEEGLRRASTRVANAALASVLARADFEALERWPVVTAPSPGPLASARRFVWEAAAGGVRAQGASAGGACRALLEGMGEPVSDAADSGRALAEDAREASPQ